MTLGYTCSAFSEAHPPKEKTRKLNNNGSAIFLFIAHSSFVFAFGPHR